MKDGVIKIILISAVIAALSFLIQGRVDMDFADEGFLWYGAIETALGKVPVRDFRAYDPGRYYWAAVGSLVFGKGIMGLRASGAVFQFLGLTFGLLSLRRVLKSTLALSLSGLVLTVWMYQRYKYYDAVMPLAAVFFAVRLLERPTLSRHIIAGVFTGLAAFFGRNHGLYISLSFLTLIFFTWAKTERTELLKRLGSWAGGVLIGYSPMLAMFALVPGFLGSYIDHALLAHLHAGVSIPVETPWPWRVDYSGLDLLSVLYNFFIGTGFLLLPLFSLSSLGAALITDRNGIRSRALFLSSASVGFYYMHYAFMRAALDHLAIAILPFLMGLLALPSSFEILRRRAVYAAVSAFILAMTLFAVFPKNPYPEGRILLRDQFVEYAIGKDRLWIYTGHIDVIDRLKLFVGREVKPDEGLLIAPILPAFYVMLGRESPVYDTYMLFPKPEEEEREMIRNLEEKNVRWAIILDWALEGREELRFHNLQPLLWRYITAEFEPVYGSGFPDNFHVFHRREDPGERRK